MSAAELEAARRLLGWIHDRANRGMASRKRVERDRALADVCHASLPYLKHWDGQHADPDPLHAWFGERP